MVGKFDWRYLLAAWWIATAIAVVALSASGFTRLFDFGQTGLTSPLLTNPRHDPAAHNLPSTTLDPFYDGAEMEERHSGWH
jgi:hypothetical protein